MREAVLERRTNETAVKIRINIDQRGANDLHTGIGFLDHMLDLFAFHAGMTLRVECEGDLEVDGHHTTEDVGITLGQAIATALGDKDGINRYGQAAIPMDESLANCVMDISGRPHLVFHAAFPAERVGDFETELTEDFFRAVAQHAGITLHLSIAYGKNTHHMIEAIFKAFGRALKQAISRTGHGVPSTKGVMEC